jgi:hypothetical protein
MDDLREQMERTLAEHQRESGLHVVGGREKMIQRLLKLLGSSPEGKPASGGRSTELNGTFCP